MGNAEKSVQLGMPYGTANGRLRKMIIFHLITRYGENICYRCTKIIDNIDTLSIEHKKPWENINPDLFWDMDNITFSHLLCNILAAGKPWGKDKDASEGHLWCTYGKHYKPISTFYKRNNARGYNENCAPCSIQIVDVRRRKTGKRPETKKFSKPSKYAP